MGNGADPDAAKVHEDYQSAPGAHKNQQGPRNVSDPDLFEPRISIANSIAEFTRVRAAVGPGPTLGTDFHTRLSVAETASLLQKMPIGSPPDPRAVTLCRRRCARADEVCGRRRHARLDRRADP